MTTRPFSRRILASALFLLALGLPACGRRPAKAVQPSPATARALPAGPVVGIQGRYGAHVWLGIPYAEPPVGDLRWRAPREKAQWQAPLTAVKYAAPCLQYASPFGGVAGGSGELVGSEDCLALDVYAPPMTAGAAAQAKLPVMVWIHGGGNAIGAASGYNGGKLAVAQNVIVVAIQYRLGPLGWFRNAALRDDAAGAEEQSGNFANLDHQLALRWVQKNIAAFGGDPANVTVFGESAGARNTLMLLLSPQAKGLFHRAIVQSGFAGCSTLDEAENSVESGGHPKSSEETLLALLGHEFGLNRAAAKEKRAAMSPAQVRAYLRGKSAKEVLGVFQPNGRPLMLYPQLFNDGVVIPGGCSDVFAGGAWNRMPVILGANRDEARLFMFGNPRYIKRRFGLLPKFVIDEQEYVLASNFASRAIRLAGTDAIATQMRASEPDVYIYRFDWDELPSVLGADLPKMLGAAHGFEIPFVFGHFNLGKEAERLFTRETEASRHALSKVMMGYWGAFAHAGRPGQGNGSQPEWKPWGAATEAARIVFDTAAGGGVRMEPGVDTVEALVADITAEKRLPSEARCELLQNIAWRSSVFTKADYEQREECKAFPFKMRTEL